MKEKNTPEIKSVHHHLAMVSRVNMILSIVSFVCVMIFALWFFLTDKNATLRGAFDTVRGSSESVSDKPAVTAELPSNTELTATYQAALTGLLKDYDFADSASAQDLSFKVLELRAPAELKHVQLEVVIALREVQSGNYTQAQERINALKKENAWFAEGIK